LLTGVALQVEDWQRDLTTNHSATSADAADPALRPIEVPLSPNDLARAVKDAASNLPRWKLLDEQIGTDVTLIFVRTTALWRFKDDITIRIEPAPTGSLLHAESRSRIGRGDLGQNPRNLRELLNLIRATISR